MEFLSKENIAQWKSKLPDDVLACLDDSIEEGDAECAGIVTSLYNLNTADDIASYVLGNQDKFIAIGRTRRIRFLAWCTRRFHSEKEERQKLISAITESGSDDEGGDTGGREKVAPVFLSDIQAFAAAISTRAAGLIVDESTLSTIAGVGFEIASDLEMRGGRGK
jgi:hypothetical protein